MGQVDQQPHLLQVDALPAAVGAGDQRHVLVAVAEGVVGDEGACGCVSGRSSGCISSYVKILAVGGVQRFR